jgi:hypothetical protein
MGRAAVVPPAKATSSVRVRAEVGDGVGSPSVCISSASVEDGESGAGWSADVGYTYGPTSPSRGGTNLALDEGEGRIYSHAHAFSRASEYVSISVS